MDYNKKLNYEGTEHVRNDLRLLYRILHSRSTARIKPQPPLMASLPKGRLRVAVGVD